MHYRVTGIDPTPLQAYFAMTDAQLATLGMVRTVVDESPGFPCRVSLNDAAIGEELLLLSYQHQPAHSPYQAAGPVFVGRSLTRPATFIDTVPPSFATRLLSVRAYDEAHLIVEAEVVDGAAFEPLATRFLAKLEVAYLHVHYARRGCYAGRVDRLTVNDGAVFAA